MISELYQKAILALAADAAGAGRLDSPDATATVHNPLCGDQVTLDLATTAERITALAHDAKACVICQASAAILGKHAVGAQRGDIDTLLAELEAMIAETGQAPDEPWAEYRHLAAVIPHRNRHECVLLPVRAVLAAFEELEGPAERS